MANSIALQLIADANPLMKGMEQAQQSISKFVDASNEAGRSIGGGLNKAIDSFMNFSKGGAGAAGILAGGFAAAATAATALTVSAAKQMSELSALSQKTGITTQTYQAWSVVMAENNFQAQTVGTAMTKLSKNMVDAKDPASNASKVFQTLGVDIKNLGSTEEVIRAVSDQFKKMPDGADKARFAVELFGQAGLDMIPMLNKGSAAFDESREAAKKYAAILDPLQKETLDLADSAMARLGVAADALKLQLGSVFAPTVIWAVEQLTDAVAWLARGAKELDVALDTLAIRLTHVGLAAKEVASVLFSKDVLSGGAWKQVADNIALIDQEAAKLIAKRRELAEVLEGAGSSVAMGTAFPSLKPEKEVKQTLWREKMIGEAIVKRTQQEIAARNQAFGVMVMEEERIRVLNLELSKAPSSGAFVAQIEKKEQAIERLRRLMPELSRDEAIALTIQNETAAEQVIRNSTAAYAKRNDELEMAISHARVLDENQRVLFESERGMFGASDAARRQRMQLIELEGELKKRMIEENIFDEKRRAHELMNLEIELDTQRRQVIQQYPSFFEQQMKSVADSNSFAIGQITNTWTSGLATAAVRGGNFVEQAWESTRIALLQGLLNFGVQKMAALALQASQEIGLTTATASTVAGINAAKNTAVVAGDAAAATASTSIWAGAAAAITGTFGAMAAAISLFFTGTIVPMFVAVGSAVMTFLSAIASSLTISIFGAPFSVPVWAAVALIGAAIGSIAAFAFADGGIVNGPTMGLVGEAGSSEAIIPLNKRGAAFMREAVGGGNESTKQQTIIVQLDGKQISRSVFDNMPSVLRVRGISA